MHIVPQSKTKLGVVAGALAMLAVAVLLIMNGSDSHAADSADDTAESAPLSVLDGPPAAGSVPFLEQQGPADGGMDFAGARVAQTNEAGSDLIALERDEGAVICVIATEPTRPQAGGGACAPRESFSAEGVFAVLMGERSRDVVGLVPDGVAEVAAIAADGSSRDVAIKNNAIRLPLEDAQQISFVVDGGRVTRDFTLPRSAG